MVRNEFERLGHNPLAFHLKCLTTDTEKGRQELDSLIKREIDAREWFVFCESPDAERSTYVKEEHAYIIDSGKENVWKLDMTADIGSILRKVYMICTDIEVFISYTLRDRAIVQPLIDTLVKRDYSVWTPEDKLTAGAAWTDQIADAIDRCTQKGFFIVVLTPASVKSFSVADELAFASSQGAWIIPVVIGEPDIPDHIRLALGKVNCLSIKPTEEGFASVADALDSLVKKRIEMRNNGQDPGKRGSFQLFD